MEQLMQIIFSRAAAEQLADTYTILELESFDVEGQLLETFCVVSADQMNLGDMPTLDHDKQLHAKFIEHLKLRDYAICEQLIPHLRGRFGGELDSFYDEVIKRFE
jgi:hypothetical protein